MALVVDEMAVYALFIAMRGQRFFRERIFGDES
jgi:hypothetical protein